MSAPERTRPVQSLGWIPWTTLVLSVAGVAVASYLTYEHFTAGTTLACPDTVVFVCYLIWAELFRINAICLWCTVVHALTLVLFALVLVRQALGPDQSG